MKIFRFRLTGTYDLLMNSPLKMSHNGSGKVGTGPKIPEAAEEAAASRYISEDGTHLYVPSQGVKSSLVIGAIGRRVNKRGLSRVLMGTVFCVEDRSILFDPQTNKPIPPTKYTVDTRRCVLQKKVGILRSRARVGPWYFDIDFDLDDEILGPEHLLQVGELSGRTVGILDFRPEHGGNFGRYKMTLLS
jgi:hypothetical protein